jgi:hypothetical protein
MKKTITFFLCLVFLIMIILYLVFIRNQPVKKVSFPVGSVEFYQPTKSSGKTEEKPKVVLRPSSKQQTKGNQSPAIINENGDVNIRYQGQAK